MTPYLILLTKASIKLYPLLSKITTTILTDYRFIPCFRHFTACFLDFPRFNIIYPMNPNNYFLLLVSIDICSSCEINNHNKEFNTLCHCL